MKYLILILPLFLLAGCSSTAIQYAKPAVDNYCKLSEETRAEYRAKVEELIAPHTLSITCSP